MKDVGSERKIAIAALIVAVLMLTVAFAAMSRTLKINGTAKVDSASWDIRFISSKMLDKKGDAREVAGPVISEDGINLTLKVGLRKPKDEITYEAVIKNLGDINAEIKSIEYPALSEEQAKIVEFVATYANGDAISKSQELKAGNEKTLKIVIKYKDITDPSLLKSEAYDIPLTFKINYIQKGQSISFDTESVPGSSENDYVDLESPKFKVTKDGTLYHYVRQGNETSVTIPATVNGVKIKKIDTAAFVSGDVMVFAESNALILLNNDYEAMAKDYATSMGMNLYYIDDFGKGTDPVELTGTGIKNFIKDSAPAISTSYKENYYLTSIDLSGMFYLEEIGDLAFGGGFDDDNIRSDLTDVKLPQNGSLTTIGEYAFGDCYLFGIEIPNTVKTIKKGAFSHSVLTGTLTIPASVEEIGENAFSNNEIENIVFEEPCKLTKINSRVFESNNITKLTIPSSITTVVYQAFLDNELTEVVVKGDTTRFDDNWSLLFGTATKIEG